MTPRVAHLVVSLLVAAGVTGCTPHPVGPARTDDAYEGKAATTAEAALSAVQTAHLVATAAGKGNVFGRYAGVVLGESEEGITTVAGTFDSIQPPSARSLGVRRELDRLLVDAGSHVATVRIAARQGRLRDLPEVGRPLVADAAALERFGERHG